MATGALTLEDKYRIQEVIASVVTHADCLEFDAIPQFFTKDATLNYVTVFGPGFEVVPVQDFFTGVADMMPGFDNTQHQVTNFLITGSGDRAESRCHVSATLRIGDRYWRTG